MVNEKETGKKSRGEKRGILGYLAGVKEEFGKVVWPTKNALSSSTLVVFAVCAFFALGFWLVDTGFLALLRKVLGITLS